MEISLILTFDQLGFLPCSHCYWWQIHHFRHRQCNQWQPIEKKMEEAFLTLHWQASLLYRNLETTLWAASEFLLHRIFLQMQHIYMCYCQSQGLAATIQPREGSKGTSLVFALHLGLFPEKTICKSLFHNRWPRKIFMNILGSVKRWELKNFQ